jgi:hypothetical protein
MSKVLNSPIFNGDLIACLRFQDDEVCEIAADEIERLRSEVQTWISHAKTAIWSDSEECKLLTEENAKLRAAISWIVPPFVDEKTPEAELRQRIAFVVADLNRAVLGGDND